MRHALANLVRAVKDEAVRLRGVHEDLYEAVRAAEDALGADEQPSRLYVPGTNVKLPSDLGPAHFDTVLPTGSQFADLLPRKFQPYDSDCRCGRLDTVERDRERLQGLADDRNAAFECQRTRAEEAERDLELLREKYRLQGIAYADSEHDLVTALRARDGWKDTAETEAKNAAHWCERAEQGANHCGAGECERRYLEACQAKREAVTELEAVNAEGEALRAALVSATQRAERAERQRDDYKASAMRVDGYWDPQLLRIVSGEEARCRIADAECQRDGANQRAYKLEQHLSTYAREKSDLASRAQTVEAQAVQTARELEAATNEAIEALENFEHERERNHRLAARLEDLRQVVVALVEFYRARGWKSLRPLADTAKRALDRARGDGDASLRALSEQTEAAVRREAELREKLGRLLEGE